MDRHRPGNAGGSGPRLLLLGPFRRARHSKFRTSVPPERVLVESDHGYADPPAASPCRIEWVEHLLAQQLGLDREEVRRLAWRNLATIVRQTETARLLPEGLRAVLAAVG